MNDADSGRPWPSSDLVHRLEVRIADARRAIAITAAVSRSLRTTRNMFRRGDCRYDT
jgi:hypothetical protein